MVDPPVQIDVLEEVVTGCWDDRTRGRDHSSLCVFRARLLAHQEEGRLFREIVSRAVKAGLLTKRAVQVTDSSPMLGAAAVQDTYKCVPRTWTQSPM